MKKYIVIIFICFAANANSQGYNIQYSDTAITLQLPRCFSWWVTKGISANINKSNFKLLNTLKPYVSDSTKPDSLFTVAIPAKYLQDGIELLMSKPSALSNADFLKIVYNQKIGATGNAIPNYTALRNQIASKANGNSSEKQVAIFLRDWFLAREADHARIYREERDDVIELTKQ